MLCGTVAEQGKQVWAVLCRYEQMGKLSIMHDTQASLWTENGYSLCIVMNCVPGAPSQPQNEQGPLFDCGGTSVLYAKVLMGTRIC